MKGVRVSVIIPTYNNVSTLGMAVASALNQDVPVEVIVVDDASAVPAVEILMDLAGDHRVRILRSNQNLGAAGARNLGIQAASAPFTAFLDADDWWAPGKLSAQLNAMKEERAVLCCTARELMRQDGTSTGRMIGVPKHITYQKLLKQNCINCSSVLLPTKIAREFPMEHDDAHEDYILWLRILKKYRHAVGINEPYLKYRLSKGSKSGSKLRSAQMTYRVYRYMGFSRTQSLTCFVSYAVHGIAKYFL